MINKNATNTEAKISNAASIQDFLMSQLSMDSEMNSSTTMAYHEMADIPLQKVDLIDQLEGHVSQLHDLQARMSFMTREIRYLLKV